MIRFFTHFHHVLAFCSLMSVDAGVFPSRIPHDAKNSFSALTTGTWYLNELYPQEWNEDENSELDPATDDAWTRLQICNDVIRSGIFELYGMRPVNMEDVYDELRQPRYSHIFHRIYRPSDGSENAQHPYTYTNPYTLQHFRLRRVGRHPINSFVDLKESVFVCLLRRVELDRQSNNDYLRERHNMYENDPMVFTRAEEMPDHMRNPSTKFPNEIIPIYVTKAYGLEFGLHVHRYVHLDPSEFGEDELLLADVSAKAYNRPDFNIEIHYLELRKYYQPAPTIPADPILRYMFSRDRANMKLTRICTIVANSSYFQERFQSKVRLVYHTIIVEREIGFRTEEGRRRANGKRYFEYLISCTVHFCNKNFAIIYISRAYNPFQVFLYLPDPSSRKLQLAMLATDVSMAQDRHNLGDVEI